MLREIWGRVRAAARSGYAEVRLRRDGLGPREMREEIARLRAENRALMNSILGIAGVPPVMVEDAAEADALRLRVGEPGVAGAKEMVGAPVGGVKARANRSAKVSGGAGRRPAGGVNRSGVAAVPMPMRRKSWHQVNRMLEIDAARKKDAGGGGSMDAEVKAGG